MRRLIFGFIRKMCDVRALCGGAPPPYALPNTSGTAGQVPSWPATPGVPLQLQWAAGGFVPHPGYIGIGIGFNCPAAGSSGALLFEGSYLTSGQLVMFAADAVSGTNITIGTDAGLQYLTTGPGVVPALFRPNSAVTVPITTANISAYAQFTQCTALIANDGSINIYPPGTSDFTAGDTFTIWPSTLVWTVAND